MGTTPETLHVVYDDLTVNCVTLRHLRDSQSPQTRSPGPTTTPIALQTAETSKMATWPPHILMETSSTSPPPSTHHGSTTCEDHSNCRTDDQSAHKPMTQPKDTLNRLCTSTLRPAEAGWKSA